MQATIRCSFELGHPVSARPSRTADCPDDECSVPQGAEASTSFRLHPDGAVQTNRFAVEHDVLNDGLCQTGIFRRFAQT